MNVQQGTEEPSPSRPKAVIFTHFGELKYGKDDQDFRTRKNKLLGDYKRILKGYLKCSADGGQIAIVYAYVNWAFQRAVVKMNREADIGGKDIFTIDVELLRQETALIGLLQMAEREARDDLALGPADLPRFHYIGISNLIDLLNNLINVDPHLADYLSGPGGQFTYDSPKFVEAVIRLARGHTPHLARYPIIRIDEDVEVNAPSMNLLLDQFSKITRKAPFFFFSGKYGNTTGSPDPKNDYAVRVHWFIDPRNQEPNNVLIEKFLADLNELGARQLDDSATYYSGALSGLMQDDRHSVPNRLSGQVISGAGLIMSSKAVNLLPPFMNFKNLTTWVDDYLKRRLHEALGDLTASDLERVSGATIKQYRPDVDDDAIKSAKEIYLDRLLRGCLFTRIIADLDGRPTQYTNLIGDIVRFRIDKNSSEVDEQNLKDLLVIMKKDAEERYDEVRRCWASDEFRGYASFEWADTLSAEHKQEQCTLASEDAKNYVGLVLEWHVFTRAIERLPFENNYWLFEPVD